MHMSQADQTRPDQTRDAILDAALKIAPFEGWTGLTLKRAVRDAGYPDGADELYFETGIGELLNFWSDRLNAQAEIRISKLDLETFKIRERVTQGVLARLVAIGADEEAARRASSRLILPDLAATGIKQIWDAADMIWRAIGDTSTDANYYSKRAILSSVIGSTLPIWLSDQSDEKTQGRAFLDAKSKTKDLPNPAELLGQIRYGGLETVLQSNFSRPKRGRARRRRYSR